MTAIKKKKKKLSVNFQVIIKFLLPNLLELIREYNYLMIHPTKENSLNSHR